MCAYQPSFWQGKTPQGRGNIWEKNVSRGLTDYLRQRGQGGDVIHLQKQIIHGMISRPQKIDILVDNAGGRYWGVECKSSGNTVMTLAAWFGSGRNGKPSQFETETEFLNNSGRIGIVALLISESDVSWNTNLNGYLIPWSIVSMIRTRKLTVERLDRFVRKRLIYKLRTTDGTFRIPGDTNLFKQLARMQNKGNQLSDEDIRGIFRSTRNRKKKCRSKTVNTGCLAGCVG